MQMRLRMIALAALLGVMAGQAAAQPERLLRGNGRLAWGVPNASMGGIMGTIAFVPPNPDIAGVALQIQPLGHPTRSMTVVAANEFDSAHVPPDIDDATRRLWLFSGRVPAGGYEITRVGVGVGRNGWTSLRQVYWHEFEFPLRIEVRPSHVTYLGRWQLTERPHEAPSPKITWPGSDMAWSDALAEDALLLDELDKKTQPKPPIFNPLPALFAAPEYTR